MKNHQSVFIVSLGAIVALLSCKGPQQDLYGELDKIDAHVHIRTEDPAIMEFAKEQRFQFLTINTKASSQEFIDWQMNIARAVDEKHPYELDYLTTFSMENFEDPGWGEKVIQGLKKDFEEGAMGVKIWKDIGMTFRDSLGNFIFIDDPKFDPIFDFIASEGKTVLGHIGEPVNCWLPIDSMTVNGDKSYFTDNPQYHMYLHPDYPSHEALMQSRDNVLANHPDLRFVGAHLGSLEWDVDELAKRFDLYPNFAVDMAARICHLQIQDRKKVREFIIKYQDRLLYATDLVISDDMDIEDRIARLSDEWKSDWKYFSGNEEMTSPDFDRSFTGLALDEEVLRKIYRSNALEWFPGLFE